MPPIRVSVVEPIESSLEATERSYPTYSPPPPPPVASYPKQLEDQGLSRNPVDTAETHRIVDTLAMQGWNAGGTVVKMRDNKFSNNRARCNPATWGMIMGHLRYRKAGGEFLPIVVRWVEDGSMSDEHPNDLLLIARSPGISATTQRILEAEKALKV